MTTDDSLRKPRGYAAEPAGRGLNSGRREPVPEKIVPGPRCPACHHGNPLRRVRCEICGEELWPSAAHTPVVALAPPPPSPEPSPPGRRSRILLVLAPLAVVAVVFAVTYLAWARTP